MSLGAGRRLRLVVVSAVAAVALAFVVGNATGIVLGLVLGVAVYRWLLRQPTPEQVD